LHRLFVYSSIILHFGLDGVPFKPYAQSIPQVARSDLVLLFVPHSIVFHVLRTLDRGFLPLLAQIHTYLRCSGYVGFICDPFSVLGTGVCFGGFGADGQVVQEGRAVRPRARTSLVCNCLKSLRDYADLGLAILDEVARKGKMVDWNRIVAIAR
jgi:hypothetical protein